MSALLAALAAALGTHLLYTSALGWRGLGLGPDRRRRPAPASASRPPWQRWVERIGLDAGSRRGLAGLTCVCCAAGALGGFALFGAPLPALVVGGCAATVPTAQARRRVRARRLAAQDGWPRLIDEIRILTGTVGRSIPQALFEAGRHGPVELQPAFAAAEREWRISTDFERTLSVLKQGLADPVADATCETLLIAHELGGSDLERRLVDLAVHRRAEVQYRKDARARQAGVRFARRFVLIVPLGMAVVGLAIGPGRQAYDSPTGQAFVVLGLAMVAACWVWAGRIMRLPEPERVFDR